MCNDDCGQQAALLSPGTSGHTSGALRTERGEGDHNIREYNTDNTFTDKQASDQLDPSGASVYLYFAFKIFGLILFYQSKLLHEKLL